MFFNVDNNVEIASRSPKGAWFPFASEAYLGGFIDTGWDGYGAFYLKPFASPALAVMAYCGNGFPATCASWACGHIDH